jgi:myo-inositol 2-dehydrogenase/D-chiro-inositol 1-dehydrogenase
MTEPKALLASSATRRDFLKASTAATVGLGVMTNAHAAGSDAIKVGLIGCGGRGSGAAEDICRAAGTSYNIKLHALG